jgi:hypothetical protein
VFVMPRVFSFRLWVLLVVSVVLPLACSGAPPSGVTPQLAHSPPPALKVAQPKLAPPRDPCELGIRVKWRRGFVPR